MQNDPPAPRYRCKTLHFQARHTNYQFHVLALALKTGGFQINNSG